MTLIKLALGAALLAVSIASPAEAAQRWRKPSVIVHTVQYHPLFLGVGF